jgi:signal transduction histidine kinase
MKIDQRSTSIWFLATLALIVGVAVLSYTSVRRAGADMESALHSQDAVMRIKAALASLDEADKLRNSCLGSGNVCRPGSRAGGPGCAASYNAAAHTANERINQAEKHMDADSVTVLHKIGPLEDVREGAAPPLPEAKPVFQYRHGRRIAVRRAPAAHVAASTCGDWRGQAEKTENLRHALAAAALDEGNRQQNRADRLKSAMRQSALAIAFGTVLTLALLLWIFYLLNREIAERRMARRQLKDSLDRVVLSNTELEQFAYVASHDLQEPLRTVTSYLQLLATRYRGRMDSDADEFIEFAVDAARRMQNMINGMLEYSRISTRKRPAETVDCNELMDHVKADLQLAIEDSGAQLHYIKLPVIRADSRQLLQLFENLINNALKFRRNGAAPAIRIAAASKREEWQFSVADNGIGIAKENYARIFEIFQRLNPPDRYPGNGMGLAVAKKIVERHNGRIWLDSDLGRGTTFHFTIPKHQV